MLISAGPAPSASAASAGTNQCIQNVSTATGVTVYQSGTSCFVAFKTATTYTWTPPTGVSKIDLLIVAGGGGAGARHAGGGGAGGLINLPNTTITTANLTIAVGGGGAGGAATASAGTEGANGTYSQVSGGGLTTQNAVGGGAGAYNVQSGTGGSSGGGGCCGQALGTATAGQGYTGSAGIYGGGAYMGGGGGGAGGAGTTSTTSAAGSGGDGLAISWVTPTVQANLSVGQTVSTQVFFAGGGGGSTNNVGTAGSGGNGGGGAGSGTTAAGSNATANTGGGGGGGGMNVNGASKGGDGGSGVVVIRYSIPSFTNSATSTFAENTTTSTNAATFTVTESSTMTIRPTLDYSLFTLVFSDSVTARVRFITSPDYEAPADIGANNDYDLTIRATNTSGNYQEFSIKITVTDVLESATINIPSLSGTAYKGRLVTITVIANVPGKVRFTVSGKRIPNCLAQLNSGAYPNYSATCAWKPALSGAQFVKATLTPTNGSISAVTSGNTSVFIYKRANTR